MITDNKFKPSVNIPIELCSNNCGINTEKSNANVAIAASLKGNFKVLLSFLILSKYANINNK